MADTCHCRALMQGLHLVLCEVDVLGTEHSGKYKAETNELVCECFHGERYLIR